MQSGSSQPGARHARRPWAFVVRDPTPHDVDFRVDWSAWYLTDEDDMGESVEQTEIIRILLSSLGQLASERGWKNAFWAGENFFAWIREEPLVRVSPDVYLLDDPPPPPRPKRWQTWLPDHKPPRWAVEIVSEDWKKDYEDAPLKYAQLGARELVIFDPETALLPERRGPRVPLQVYRRDPDGAFLRVYSAHAAHAAHGQPLCEDDPAAGPGAGGDDERVGIDSHAEHALVQRGASRELTAAGRRAYAEAGEPRRLTSLRVPPGSRKAHAGLHRRGPPRGEPAPWTIGTPEIVVRHCPRSSIPPSRCASSSTEASTT